MNAKDAARRWARAWTQGWEALDPEPILACYGPDALLSTQPSREPYRGIDSVREYVTLALGQEEDPRVWVAEPIVAGDCAPPSRGGPSFDEGADATLPAPALRFDADGLVAEQWDAWNQILDRHEPPERSRVYLHDS